MDMVIRLATTINAYEDVAFTSKSTNMGTYVYEKLDAIPEEFRPRLMDELSDVGLVNCWYIAGLLYKVKFQEREAGGALDISSDLEDYQERLDATVEQAAASGADFSLDESADDDDDYADDAGALEVIDDDAPDLTKLAQKNKLTKASWKLSLSIGRETGTWMPEEWAASGARLLLPITVEFDSEPYPGEPEALVGQTSFRVRPVGESSFVGVGGKVTVPVRGGAWAIQPPKPPQKPALLRFWLEFPEEAKRNDVTLPPGRVFFTAPVWQEIELERGAEARKEARERYEEAETKSAELADQAVKANPLAKIFGLRKQVLALDEKNAALRKLERVERYLGGSSEGGAGPFPGLAAGASLTLGTTGGLVVKRTPRIGVGTEYHILGKFQAQAAASDG